MNQETYLSQSRDHLSRWKNREETAEKMLGLIGQLYRQHGVVVTLYGRSLVNRSVIQILKATA